jgi:hypothetical protein
MISVSAVARGELPEDIDIGICLDLLAGSLYWRLIVAQIATDDGDIDRLAGKVATAMKV